MTTETSTKEIKPNVASYGFDTEDYDAEVEAAAKGGFGNGTYPVFVATPGYVTKFAKIGQYEVTMPDPDDPKQTIKNVYSAFEGVILDSSFNREYWFQKDGKSSVICQTVKHRKPKDSEDQAEWTGNGKWKIPYGHKLTMERYCPVGTKGESCEACIAAGHHGKDPGKIDGQEGCRQAGHLIVAMMSFTMRNPMTNKLEKIVLEEPRLLHVQTPPTSGIEYQKYTTSLAKDKYRIDSILTSFKTKPNDSGTTTLLDLNRGELADEAFLATAKALYKSEIDRIEEDRKKKAEERKAQSGQTRGAGKKDQTPAADAEENFDWESEE